jgi:hypothetical protein
MRIQLSRSCATLVAITLLAACGGDSTTRPGDTLTPEQAAQMSYALGTVLGTSFVPSQSLAASRMHVDGGAPMRDQFSYSVERECSQGGRVAVAGTLSTASGNFHMVTNDTLDACATKDANGDVWTFTTQPTLTSILDISGYGESTITTVETDDGKIRFSSGTLAGTCSIALSLNTQLAIGTPTADSATMTLHSAGSVCGRSVTSDAVVTVPWTQFVPVG